MVQQYERRVRRVWPDVTVKGATRYKVMGAEYRAAAKRLKTLLDDVAHLALHCEDPVLLARLREYALEPDPVRTLDERFHEGGEDWHLDPGQTIELTFDDDDLLPARDAAVMLAAEVGSVAKEPNWLAKARSIGRIEPVGTTVEGVLLYRVGDVRQLIRDYGGKPWQSANPKAEPVVRSGHGGRLEDSPQTAGA